MAVDWRGSTVTPPIVGYPTSGEYVFALVNTFRSRHLINVLRLVCVGDSVELSTTAGHIMPLLKTVRCSAANVSGGISIDKRPPWDTGTNAPDPHIKLLYSGWGVSEANRLTVASPGAKAWQQFVQRAATTVEQRRALDNSVLCRLSATKDFILLPGQAIAVSWNHGTQPVGGSIFFNIAWEEDEVDEGFTLGGAVTLDSAPVEDARVFVLTDSDQDMPDPELESFATNASGEWSTTLATGVRASVFVQHRDGTDLYTDEGKPFVEGP